MKDEKTLNRKIIDITMLIQNNHPELSNYLTEMNTTLPMDTNPEINVKLLSNYLNSLESLLFKYEIEVVKKEDVIV